MKPNRILLTLAAAGALVGLGLGPAQAAPRATNNTMDLTVGTGYGLVKDNWNTGTNDQGEFELGVGYLPSRSTRVDLAYDFRSYFQTYFHADGNGNYQEMTGRELWHDIRLTVGVGTRPGSTLSLQPYVGPHILLIRPGIPDVDMNLYGLMGGVALTWSPGADAADLSFTVRGEATLGLIPSTGSASFLGDALGLWAAEGAANYGLTRECALSLFIRTDVLQMSNGDRFYNRAGLRLNVGF